MIVRPELMQRALSEAERARGRTRPNPLVGCVIAKAGRIIATGFHARAGSAHAEVAALEQAGAAARGADVYVTLEPCNHYGRTGPCTEALIAAGVARVIVGTRDPNPLVDGRGVRRLRRAGIPVEVGLLGDACRRLNEQYICYIRQKRPFGRNLWHWAIVPVNKGIWVFSR
jgi:diaminohydroxyphosphoribosylaminopyrimidine deaminase/5-amino-6-(5-phosphoribosylamino)uracil reductase